MSISFDHPVFLWLLLLAAPIVWLGMRSLSSLDTVRRWTAIGIRLAVLLVLTLMLAGLQAVRTHEDLTVIAVLDQSESVRRYARPPEAPKVATVSPQKSNEPPPTIEQWQREYLRRAGADRRTSDRFGLITYDDRPSVRAAPSDLVDLDPGTITQPVEGTDTASAIRTAIAMFPADSGARILLSSDLNDTSGDTLAAAREAAAAGIPIDVLPLNYRVENEIVVDGLYAPTEAREGQAAPLRVVLRATEPSSGLLQLRHDGDVIDLNGDAPGTGTPIDESDWTLPPEDEPFSNDTSEVGGGRYLAVKQIDLPLRYTGPNRFEAIFESDDPNDLAVNNKAEAFTLVAGKGRVLFVDGLGGQSGSVLPRALQSHGVELDVIKPVAFPTRIDAMQRYDAIVFQNVAAADISPPQQKSLVRYVHDLGGGFLMVGGPDAFGAGAWNNSDVDRYLLPVASQIPSQTILPSGALVLVIDRSGSMSAPVAGTTKSQQEVAGEAAVLALSTLYPQDLVGVVAFDDTAKLVVDVQLNSDPARVASLIRSINPGGGTDIYAGLDLAYRKLAPMRADDAAIKHIILLTDGQSQVGNYIKLAGQMNAAGITVSTIGVGDGHNSQLLKQIARMGQGNYHGVQNPANLPKVFIKEAKTIRKNLIKEATFNPTLINAGSPIMTGIDAVPPLRGFVLTGRKDDPRIFMPIVGPEDEPIFAHWQVGLGRAAAFTSDATNRWATPWLEWDGYADFWARTVRAIARPSASRDVDLVTTIANDRLTVRIDAAGQGDDRTSGARRNVGAFGNFLSVQGSVITPDGDTMPVTLQQTGPGVYETDVPATTTGNYITSLFVEQPDGTREAVFGGTSRPPGAELRQFQSDTALMRQITEITGGRLLDPETLEPAGLFERTIPFESRSIRPLWRTLLVWLFVLFLLDVACRRIAWDLGASWSWIMEAIGGATRSIESDAGSTLTALKRTRDRSRRDVPEPVAVAAPARTRKFEAAPNAVAADNFADAVGGAKRSNGRMAVSDAESAISETSTLGALRRAKQRAQDRNE